MTSICIFNPNLECPLPKLAGIDKVLDCPNCLRSKLVVEVRRLRVTGIQT